jgi:hypothetical protein
MDMRTLGAPLQPTPQGFIGASISGRLQSSLSFAVAPAQIAILFVVGADAVVHALSQKNIPWSLLAAFGVLGEPR